VPTRAPPARSVPKRPDPEAQELEAGRRRRLRYALLAISTMRRTGAADALDAGQQLRLRNSFATAIVIRFVETRRCSARPVSFRESPLL
jgi:hypothetical protein